MEKDTDYLDKMQPDSLDEAQKGLVDKIGLDSFKALVRAYGGSFIYIPKIESLGRTVRDKMIKEEFDGSNYKELALKYGLTEVWIRNIVSEKAAEIRRKPIDGQMNLEDFLY